MKTYKELAADLGITLKGKPKTSDVYGGWICNGCSALAGRSWDEAKERYVGPVVRHENSHATYVCFVNRRRKEVAESGDNVISAIPQ